MNISVIGKNEDTHKMHGLTKIKLNITGILVFCLYPFISSLDKEAYY